MVQSDTGRETAYRLAIRSKPDFGESKPQRDVPMRNAAVVSSTLKDFIMKKLSLIALAIVATSAMAQGNGHNHSNGNGHGNGNGGPSADPTMQATMLVNTSLSNSAFGPGATSQQNLASNVGNVSRSGNELQLVMAKNSSIVNKSWGGTAEQNIASNVGDGGLSASTYQIALIKDSSVVNHAGWGGYALQNISSNSNCVSCAQ
jgi:hypothetical protein